MHVLFMQKCSFFDDVWMMFNWYFFSICLRNSLRKNSDYLSKLQITTRCKEGELKHEADSIEICMCSEGKKNANDLLKNLILQKKENYNFF